MSTTRIGSPAQLSTDCDLFFDYSEIVITPATWKADTQRLEQQYKKLKTPAALSEWKSCIDNTNIVKNFNAEIKQVYSDNKLEWVDSNLALLKFTQLHLQGIRNKVSPEEIKAEAPFYLNDDLENKITAAARRYANTPSESAISVWKDLTNQLPSMEELILIHSIFDVSTQIDFLETHIREMEIFKQQLQKIEAVESKLHKGPSSYHPKSVLTACLPLRLLNKFCLFHFNVPRVRDEAELLLDSCRPNGL